MEVWSYGYTEPKIRTSNYFLISNYMLQKINISLLVWAAFILGMVISDYGNGYHSPYVIMKDSDIHSAKDLENQYVSKAQTERALQAIFESN